MWTTYDGNFEVWMKRFFPWGLWAAQLFHYFKLLAIKYKRQINWAVFQGRFSCVTSIKFQLFIIIIIIIRPLAFYFYILCEGLDGLPIEFRVLPFFTSNDIFAYFIDPAEFLVVFKHFLLLCRILHVIYRFLMRYLAVKLAVWLYRKLWDTLYW